MDNRLTKKKFLNISYRTQRQINGFIFVLPWLIGFLLFLIIPFVNTVIYSFSAVNVKETGGMVLDFTGIQNYIDLFNTEVSSDNQQIVRILVDENIRIFTNTPLIVIFSLFAALLGNAQFKGRGVLRVILFLPIILGLNVVVSLIAVSTGGDITSEGIGAVFETESILMFLLRYTFLPINIIHFLSDTVSNIFILISQAGVQTLIFLAGLQSISPSLYEVAKIEGANAYELFWKVTLPLLSNITVFVVIYTLVELFLGSTISHEIYNFAFSKSKIGVGSALSIVYMFNILLDLGILVLIMKKVVNIDYGSKL